MKTQIIKRAILALMMAVTAATAYAYDFEVDGIYYNKLSDGKSVEVTYKDTNLNSYSGSVTIPSQVTYIGTTYSVTSIGNAAFAYCSGLKSVTIPNSLTSIGANAFNGCTGLTSVKITDISFWCKIEFTDFDSNPLYYAHHLYLNDTEITDLVIPNSVTSIGNNTFYGCSGLKSVTFPGSVTSIGASAFNGCTGLTSVKITDISSWCKIEFTDFDSNPLYYAHHLYLNDTEITDLVIPNSVTSLGTSAFENCSALESATIGTGVPALPQRVFYGCKSLASLSIPNNVASIGNNAFAGCVALTDLTFEDSEDPEDSEPQIKSISFDNWTSTNHNHSSTSYKEYSFNAEIGDVLTFNYTVSSESGYDFLIIKLNGTQIVGESGTKSGSYSKEFTEAGAVTLYLSYSKDSSTSSGSDEASVTDIWLNGAGFAQGVLTLGSNGSSPLFVDCPLDEVYIGRKLSYTTASGSGYSPFYRNASLRTVEITDAETQIYDNEFYGCSSLQSLKIGDGVTTIGKWAFSGCSALEYFSVGSMVESIGQEAFSDCTSLTSFTSNAPVPPICGNQALDDINKWECTLYVPAESIGQYKVADQWKDFFFIEESGIEDIIVDADTSDAPVEYYNLQGIRIENPANGIYIRRQGSSTTKVSIR